ncbi:hypothetical protein E4T56_gene8737, partial [Termitomyces sp. T112]
MADHRAAQVENHLLRQSRGPIFLKISARRIGQHHPGESQQYAMELFSMTGTDSINTGADQQEKGKLTHHIHQDRSQGTAEPAMIGREKAAEAPRHFRVKTGKGSLFRILQIGIVCCGSHSAASSMFVPLLSGAAGPALHQQFIMASALDDAPIVQHDDLISSGKSGKAVGDDDRGLIPPTLAQCIPQLSLGFRVERR